jgi:hypothetical protein
MTPELKAPSVTMPFNGFTQQAYAQKMIDEYKAAGVHPRDVFPQSFNQADVLYWVEHEPAFGKQACIWTMPTPSRIYRALVISSATSRWASTSGRRPPSRCSRSIRRTKSSRHRLRSTRKPPTSTSSPGRDEQGRRLENFTRVETFGNSTANGNNDVHWLKVIVRPGSREVFSYEPQIVPDNRTAVPTL